MNRSLLGCLLLPCVFLLSDVLSGQAQILLTKNIPGSKKSVLSNALSQTTAATQQPDVAAFSNKLNAEGLRFTENNGQVADLKGNLRPDVLFTAHNGGAKLFLTADGICYQFSRQFLKKKIKEGKLPSKFTHPDIDSTQFYRVDVKLAGANLHPHIVKEGEGSGVENFYLAHCPKGILNVKNYSRITYKNVYPNIDWVVYSKEGKLEYDFVVNPGGKVSDIKLAYDGAENIGLDNKGEVIIETRLGSVSEHKPVSYQQHKSIESSFVLDGSTLSFAVKEYDKSKVLTIDPEIVWGTYYGGESGEKGNSCSADKMGNVYLAGETSSNSGIAYNGFQTSRGDYYYTDAFLAKFDSAGSRLWATYYGGSEYDQGISCAADTAGNIYLAGNAQSLSDIAYNGFQNTFDGPFGDQDAFLVKFNSSGARVWGTYYGGALYEFCNSCITDGSGNVYLAGFTDSDTGIAYNGFQNSGGTFRNRNAFLVKFNSAGNRLWGTYYGGNQIDEGNACTTDNQQNVYLAGNTSSYENIASNGFENKNLGNNDAFLVKFNSAGDRLWGTYYGSDILSGATEGTSCAVDGAGNVYLSGFTEATSGISSNGFQNTFGGFFYDAFLVKFTNEGSRLWATYYGGAGDDKGTSCAADGAGNVYLSGFTSSYYNDGSIASNGFQNTYGGDANDAFLVKFNSSGSRLWGSYYGGEYPDQGNACITNGLNVYLAGTTQSNTNIAFNGFQDVLQGLQDAFLVKISDTGNILPLHLLSFTASLQNKAVNLAWQTAQEVNTSYFVIERSRDGSNYTSLQQVAASSSNGAYTAIDNSPLYGKSLYRLKMVDKDGKVTYSNAVPISYIIKNIVTVSPNPASDKLIVQLQSVSNGKANIDITDVNGKVVYAKQMSIITGENTLPVQVAKFAKGAYFLTVRQGDDKQMVKWIKE